MSFDPPSNNTKAQLYDSASDERNLTVRFAVALQSDCDNAVNEISTDGSWLQNSLQVRMPSADFVARGRTRAHDALQREFVPYFFDNCLIGCLLRTSVARKTEMKAFNTRAIVPQVLKNSTSYYLA